MSHALVAAEEAALVPVERSEPLVRPGPRTVGAAAGLVGGASAAGIAVLATDPLFLALVETLIRPLVQGPLVALVVGVVNQATSLSAALFWLRYAEAWCLVPSLLIGSTIALVAGPWLRTALTPRDPEAARAFEGTLRVLGVGLGLGAGLSAGVLAGTVTGALMLWLARPHPVRGETAKVVVAGGALVAGTTFLAWAAEILTVHSGPLGVGHVALLMDEVPPILVQGVWHPLPVHQLEWAFEALQGMFGAIAFYGALAPLTALAAAGLRRCLPGLGSLGGAALALVPPLLALPGLLEISRHARESLRQILLTAPVVDLQLVVAGATLGAFLLPHLAAAVLGARALGAAPAAPQLSEAPSGRVASKISEASS